MHISIQMANLKDCCKWNIHDDFYTRKKTLEQIAPFIDKKKILRLNWYSADVLYFNGAETSNRTKENCAKTAQLMMEKYPEYITSIKHNKNGFKSLRLKRLK